MKIGANDIAAVKIGSVDVNKVYIGSNLVWQKQAESYLLELFPNSEEAYSLRQLQSNGGIPYPLVLVRRSSDNAEQSFTETQIIDGTLEAFCGAGNGQVVSWYDQSGNNNHVNQSTASNQPYIVISGNLVTDNGKPTLYFNSLSELVSVNNTNYGTSSRSIFITVNLLEGISTKGIISLSNLSTVAGSLWILTPEIATRANTYTWITSTPLPQNNQSLLTNIYASSANLFDGNNMYLDGSAIVRTLGANGVINTTVGKMYIGSNGLGSNRVLANISEIVNYKSDQSTNRTQIESNINSYYNIYPEGGYDQDAQNYFDRVALNGGTLSILEKTAVNDLVVDLKSNGLWSKIKAAYPMVGSSAAACAVNLKSSSFKGTFTSGWTFSATGAKPNGTSAYMNTFLNPLTAIANANDGHLSYYSRTESLGAYIEIGCSIGSTSFDLVVKYNDVAGACINMRDTNVFSYTGTTKGFFIGSQNNTPNIRKYIRDGSVIQTQSIAQNEQPNANVFVGARNSIFFSNRECAFASIGNGLSDTEAANYNTVVQQFQTNLSRNV